MSAKHGFDPSAQFKFKILQYIRLCFNFTTMCEMDIKRVGRKGGGGEGLMCDSIPAASIPLGKPPHILRAFEKMFKFVGLLWSISVLHLLQKDSA